MASAPDGDISEGWAKAMVLVVGAGIWLSVLYAVFSSGLKALGWL